MLLTPLPKPQFHSKLFFDYKQRNEHLGLAKLNKGDLCFDTVHEMEDDIKNFFLSGIDNPPDWSYLYKNYTVPSKEYHHYRSGIENYCKLVWLATDYVNEGGLKDPIGVHYDPEVKKWMIHPGGSRQKILHLFAKGIIDTIAFNTSGKEISFDKIFNSWHDVLEQYGPEQIHIVVVADHATLIPHIHFSSGANILDHIKKTYNQVVQFYKTTRIKTNFPISEYQYKQPKKYKTIINITLDNPLDLNQQIIAFCLAPTFGTYHGHGVHIETIT